VVVCVNVNRASFFFHMYNLTDHRRFIPPYSCPVLTPPPWGYGRHGSIPLAEYQALYYQFQAFWAHPEVQVLETSIDSLTTLTDPQ
jgi:hypothetical protein